jgi:hypothetical protein
MRAPLAAIGGVDSGGQNVHVPSSLITNGFGMRPVAQAWVGSGCADHAVGVPPHPEQLAKRVTHQQHQAVMSGAAGYGRSWEVSPGRSPAMSRPGPRCRCSAQSSRPNRSRTRSGGRGAPAVTARAIGVSRCGAEAAAPDASGGRRIVRVARSRYSHHALTSGCA